MRLLGTLAGVVMLVAGGSLLSTSDMQAQAAPPTRVYGAVSVDGETPPVGTPVEAFIGDMRCGTGEVRELGDPIGVGFVVDVDADAFNPGCGNDGETITFAVGGVPAAESATFRTGAFVQQDLTASGQVATPTPEATPTPSAPSTPAPSPTPSPTPVPTPTPTPAASPTATASPEASPTATTTPTDAATGTPTATASPTASPDRTPTATVVATVLPADEDGESGDGGVSPAVWVVLVLAVLAAGGAGAYLYQRRRGGAPPA
jgi:hypothetical protein